MVTSKHSNRILVGLLILGMLGLSLLISNPARAQVVGATLSGTVTDNSGAAIPNAQVSIKNVATGVTRSVTTDTAGFYQAPNLDSGNYDVNVTASGFKRTVQSGLNLTVGAQQTLNIAMQVGEVSQSVEVTAEAPVVQLTSSSIGSLVNATTVVELPLNGRDWGSLAALSPGVATVQVQMGSSATTPKGNRGYGNQMTIAGTRPQMNNYRLDGVSIVDYSGGTPASVIALTLGVDAIAEFSVTTSNHSAEYGRTSGGVINAITKSGTNQFHGDAYWFIRDEGFDARSANDPSGQALPPFHRNQYGGSIGGPILKNKTFFFTNVEMFRQTRTTTNNAKVPTQAARDGFVYSPGSSALLPVSGSCASHGPSYIAPTGTGPSGTTPICLDAALAPFWAFYPVPAASTTNSNVGVVGVGTPTVGSENYYTSRIDHTISSKDSLSGSFFIDAASFSQPDAMRNLRLGNTSRRTMVTASETHIFSAALVNSLRIGYSRQHMIQNNFLGCLVTLACDTSGTVSSVAGRAAPAIQVQNVLTAFNGGAHEATQNQQPWNSYQLYDDAFLTKGAHSMKFGFVVENMRHSPSNVQTLNSSWFFPSVVGLLQGTPQSLRLPATSYGYPLLRQTLFGGYFQDDWRIRPNLTLNLGLRYEAATVMSEPKNNLQNLACISCTTPIIGNPLYHNPTLRNFEPRVGFAWDPFKDGKTSIRGAFGQFDMLPLIMEMFTAAQASSPQAGQLQILGSGSLGGVVFPLLPSAPPSGTGQTIDFTEPNPKRNYVLVWNASVQRQLTTNTSVTFGYVGNRGVHMAERFGTLSVNQPLGFTAAGYPYWPGGTGVDPVTGGPKNMVGTGTPYNATVGSMVGMLWGGDSHYHALEASVDKKFSHGFQAQGSFTWGNGTDTSSATTISDPYVNSISTLWWFCKICRKGPSDFNITKRLTANFIWDIPTPKSWSGFAAHALGGWEVNSIITAMSGTPFSVFIGGDPEGTNTTDSPNSIYPNYTPGCNPVNSGSTSNYINISCFTLPTAPSGSSIACSNFGANAAGVGGVPGGGTCANLQGNAGRNMLTGPGLFDMDFSIMKNTKIPRISETFNVQFRAEMFNVINHPSWQAPINSNQVFDQDGSLTGGAGNVFADGVTVTGREIQFGLKFIF